ncbi:MAG: VCBS repeat-containing protein [Bacteroidia bacterium]|nr:VCBS repeat-containing protein [Bacteroidia bacterium]
MKRSYFYILFLMVATGLLLSCGQEIPKEGFKKLSQHESGIDFFNEVIEDEHYNALDFTNIYTGSGVGIGDLNNDGLPEVFFGGCQKSSKLFLNKGDLQFQDITLDAGVSTDRWITGVSMVDVNADGLLDIYLCVSGPPVKSRENLLFINKGQLKFEEVAAEYGLNEADQCTQASFLDYDKDGDLDVFMVVNPTDYTIFNVNNIRKRKLNGEAASTDKLYENLGNGQFRDVSAKSGILIEGYSLGLHAGDFNDDGWTDIYVSNDFISNDILYINQQDGTFTDLAQESFKHSSYASMGIDVADLNNDGRKEIFVADMYPENREHEKMMMPGADHNRFRYILQTGYYPQYSRNILQYNQGQGKFSEIGQYAGVHKTDWSWSPLIADFDNDGLQDLFISNGFYRDLGDLDYINYNGNHIFGTPEKVREKQLARIKTLPGIKLPNYLYHNEGKMTFTNKAHDWGMADSTYSQGAAYGDLDQDGDLDLVLNNMNQYAFVYENLSNIHGENHFLSLHLEGEGQNTKGLGAKIWLFQKDKIQFRELQNSRGYASSVDYSLQFGLGKDPIVDSIKIEWPSGKLSRLSSPAVDSQLVILESHAQSKASNQDQDLQKTFYKKNLIDHLHEEERFSDFDQNALLPHNFNGLGPAIATGDLNGDQLEDLFVGAAAGKEASIYIQQNNGSFKRQSFPFHPECEDIDALIFDADGDGDNDLYVASGGSTYGLDTKRYQDRLYENLGSGKFTFKESGLPTMESSTSFVKASDIDNDGDLDLLIGSRLVPGNYPEVPSSYLLENNSGQFKDITHDLIPDLEKLGMLTDAIWVDLTGNKKEELVIVGEWMPVTVFQWEAGKLMPSDFKGLDKSNGWWQSLTAGDFDQDGDIDLIAGNLGLNTNYRADSLHPMCLYAKDFDNNGRIDPILCNFVGEKEYPIASRDHFLNQLKKKQKQFSNYSSYARASILEVFDENELADVEPLRAYTLSSEYIENLGGGRFRRTPLPWPLQIAPITDFHVEDMNHDGRPELLAVGNDYSTEVKIGRYDAFTGAWLRWDQDRFEVQTGLECGLLADKDAVAIKSIRLASGEQVYLIANNADSLEIFGMNTQLLPQP